MIIRDPEGHQSHNSRVIALLEDLATRVEKLEEFMFEALLGVSGPVGELKERIGSLEEFKATASTYGLP